MKRQDVITSEAISTEKDISNRKSNIIFGNRHSCLAAFYFVSNLHMIFLRQEKVFLNESNMVHYANKSWFVLAIDKNWYLCIVVFEYVLNQSLYRELR